jgi:putative flippase GtrA
MLKNKVLRFFLVSGLNTAFGYGLFAFLIFIGLHYAIAGLIGTIIAVAFNFKTIGMIVFNNNNNRRIYKFMGVYGINYVISILLLTVLEQSGIDTFLSNELYQSTNILLFKIPRVNACIGGALLVIPMGLFAFALNHRFVFSEPALVPAKEKKSERILIP